MVRRLNDASRPREAWTHRIAPPQVVARRRRRAVVVPATGEPDGRARIRVLSVFGTRPEIIKFMPVLRELDRRPEFRTVNVLTSQHVDLIRPLLEEWRIRIDHDLEAMVSRQPLNLLLGRILSRLDPILAAERPDLVLVQGDTTSALAATLAAWHQHVPLGHIEAGLRSGNRASPFPEEANRRLITMLASLHFAPTQHNVDTLLGEGVPAAALVKSGNPVVDAVGLIRGSRPPSPAVRELLERLAGQRIVLLTTHRREGLGQIMRQRLRVLREFVAAHQDVELVFPVHPNPEVGRAAEAELAAAARVHLLPPLDYPDFLHCLAAAWLVVSDSGGVQEEAPSLGKALLVLRPDTERPEALACRVARLVGDDPEHLRRELALAAEDDGWVRSIRPIDNPFGRGDSARRIADGIAAFLARRRPAEAQSPLAARAGAAS